MAAQNLGSDVMTFTNQQPNVLVHGTKTMILGSGILSMMIGLGALISFHVGSPVAAQVRSTFTPVSYHAGIGFVVIGIGFLSLASQMRVPGEVGSTCPAERRDDILSSPDNRDANPGTEPGRDALPRARADRPAGPPSAPGRWIALACGITTAAMAAFDFFDLNSAIGRMAAPAEGASADLIRLYPSVAACFFMTGLALVSMSNPGRVSFQALFLSLLGTVTLALAAFVLFGYAAQMPAIFGWGSVTQMSLAGAIILTLSGLSIFAFAWKEDGASESQMPKWIPLPIGAAVLTITFSLWQTLRIDTHSPFPEVTLAGGLLIAVLLPLTTYLAQKAHLRARAWERVNEELQNEIIKRRQIEETLRVSEETLREKITERQKVEEQVCAYQDKLQSLTSELFLSEERERRRIATNLHDQIGQTLAFAKFKLKALRQWASVAGLDHLLDEVKGLVEQAISDTRSLTFELSPPVLYELGLVAAIEWLARKTQQDHGITVRFHDDGQVKPLDEDFRVVLFQVVRELLVNVVKHAQAKHVNVLMRRDSDALRIVVEDDGIGFAPSEKQSYSASTTGFGLFNIRERLNYLGGQMKIRSERGYGTRITLLAPLNLNETQKS
jgi:signal transduction histidine kinase